MFGRVLGILREEHVFLGHLVQQAAVPEAVQVVRAVAAVVAERHDDLVPALVVIVGAMQRLGHVAHEMDQEHERFAARHRRGRGVLQNFLKILDLGDHAVALGAIARHVQVRFIDGDIDIVPRPRIAALVAHVVGPTGDGLNGHIGAQDLADAGLHRGSQLNPGDTCNQAVPFATPAERRQTSAQNGNQKFAHKN